MNFVVGWPWIRVSCRRRQFALKQIYRQDSIPLIPSQLSSLAAVEFLVEIRGPDRRWFWFGLSNLKPPTARISNSCRAHA